MKNKILVIGAGRLGSQFAKKLSNDGENVLVLDKDSEAFGKLEDFSGFSLTGDATDLHTLESCDVENCKMVIITTDSDNVNIFIAHVCYHIYGVENVFIRLYDSDKWKLLENTTIQAIYPFVLSMECLNKMIKNLDK